MKPIMGIGLTADTMDMVATKAAAATKATADTKGTVVGTLADILAAVAGIPAVLVADIPAAAADIAVATPAPAVVDIRPGHR